MKKCWVVAKVVSPLGSPCLAYLKISHDGWMTIWDEEHDATVFTFWEACWQGLKHRAMPMKKG